MFEFGLAYLEVQSLYIVFFLCIHFSSAVVTIGFNKLTYSVLEDAGSVNVTVSILNGTLVRNVVVTFSTVPSGTATGKLNITFILM